MRYLRLRHYNNYGFKVSTITYLARLVKSKCCNTCVTRDRWQTFLEPLCTVKTNQQLAIHDQGIIDSAEINEVTVILLYTTNYYLTVIMG